MDSIEGRQFQPSNGLVTAITVLLIAEAVMAGIGASSGWMEVQLLQAIQDGYEVSDDKIFANDVRQAIIGLIQVAIYIPLAILFLRYLWRANHNARALTGSELAYTPGSCVWWFFIPIACLFKPYSAVKEIWQASTPQTKDQEPSPGSPLLALWWTFWIISSIAGNISIRMNFNADESSNLLIPSWMGVIENILAVFLAVLALGVIKSIYRMQMFKAQQVFGTATPDTQQIPQQQVTDNFNPNMPAPGTELENNPDQPVTV